MNEESTPEEISIRQVKEYLGELASHLLDAGDKETKSRAFEYHNWAYKVFDFLDFLDKLTEYGIIEKYEEGEILPV